MDVLLWILQAFLTFWFLWGGSYVITHYETIRATWAAGLPAPVWIAYAVIEIILAIGLVWPKFTRYSAIGLLILSVAGCGLFGPYSGFPGCLWALIPAALLAFIAYGRFKLKP